MAVNLNNQVNYRADTSLFNYKEVTMYSNKSHRAPGSGSISKNPSGTYRAQITIPSTVGNKPHRETHSFKTKREAEEWMRQTIHEVDAGLSAENHNITLDEYHKKWLVVKQLKVRIRTLDDYQRLCRLYIVPYFGNRSMRNIKTADINDFYISLVHRGTGVPTIGYVHRVLRTIFSNAIREGVVNFNPCMYASRPKTKKSRNAEVMSESDLVAFLDLADKTSFGMLFRTAGMTGLRLGELLGLTWGDVNFAKGKIHVNKQIPTRHVKGTKRVATETKTDAGNRILPVGNTLLRDLQRHQDLQKAHIAFMGSSWKDQNLVFPSNIGTPLQAGYLEKASKQIFAVIGLDNSFTFHNLRHTAASIMLNNGMSLVEVSKYLGHSSPTVTAEIYAHVMPGGLEKAVSVFDKVIPSRE
jgi:integrase